MPRCSVPLFSQLLTKSCTCSLKSSRNTVSETSTWATNSMNFYLSIQNVGKFTPCLGNLNRGNTEVVCWRLNTVFKEATWIETSSLILPGLCLSFQTALSELCQSTSKHAPPSFCLSSSSDMPETSKALSSFNRKGSTRAVWQVNEVCPVQASLPHSEPYNDPHSKMTGEWGKPEGLVWM